MKDRKTTDTKIEGGHISTAMHRDNSSLDVGGVRDIADSNESRNSARGSQDGMKNSMGGMPKSALKRGY